MLLFVCHVSIQNMVVYVGNCHFCAGLTITEAAVTFLDASCILWLCPEFLSCRSVLNGIKGLRALTELLPVSHSESGVAISV